MLENKVNQTSFKATRSKLAQHPRRLERRGAISVIKKGALVDRTVN